MQSIISLNVRIYGLSLFLIVLSTFEAQTKAVEVHAIASTEVAPIKSDVMDDPAIWVNKNHPTESLILGTNKREPYGGLYIYDLRGILKDSLAVGPLNNVDIRTEFPYRGKQIDIAVASHTERKQLAFFSIDPYSGAINLLGFSLTPFEKNPYGLCLSKQGKDFYAIVTFSKGGAEKWKFWEEHGRIQTKKVNSYPIQTQAEGCVADDLNERLFLAEEDKGIWVFKDEEPPQMVAKVGEYDLVNDLEGLALYDNTYLIVSSQGNSSYGIFYANPPYQYLGNFVIAKSETQESTEETDGIDVTSADLGGHFKDGLFVAHDNRSSKGGGSNFKLVPWSEIAKGLKIN